ncbi:alpha/beta hydrolase [Candidatus Woesearchaeota archaeon]|nr:alpha/beta hydrolase [Candidatus Woesearchaeota archaeon]
MSFDIKYGESKKAEFDVSMDNFAYCRASCSYSFTDISRNELIDKGNFEIERKQHVTKSYDLSIKRLGSGQDIYSFDAACHSIRSLLCLTKSPEKFRSSLITVDYDLTEIEKSLKDTLKQNATKLLELLSGVDILHQQVNQKYFKLGFNVNLDNLTKHKIEIDDGYDKTRISIENLRSLWSIEDYAKLNRLFNSSFFETLYGIRESMHELDKEINTSVELHNLLLSALSDLNTSFKELNSIVNILNDSELTGMLDNSSRKFNEIAASVTGNKFDDYNSVFEGALNITKQQDLIYNKSMIPAAYSFFNLGYKLKYWNDLLCSIKQDCSGNFSIAGQIIDAEKFIEEYPDASYFKQGCSQLHKLNQEYLDANTDSLRLIKDKNIVFPLNDEFLTLANIFKDNEIGKINNSYFESFEELKVWNMTSPEIMPIANHLLPKNRTAAMQLDYNRSINLSLYILSKINFSDEAQLSDKCSKLDIRSGIADYSFENVSPNIEYSIISGIDSNLSDNPPICCVFNDCKPCCRDDSCRNDPKTFPIIFLHGHSFAKDNSPEFSLDSFNKLQAKLQEDGYLNAGIVSLYSQNEPLQAGIWGFSGRPVSIKASYYYDAFRQDDKYIAIPTKSENIDTYAVRLKNLVDIVKGRTNKPKVNIIAHSMGGLVARRYIQIFGDDNVDKLMMIATPNKGISGSVGDYCGLIGENRECQDMHENSLFINKLNDPSRQPDKVKIYLVIGQGCQMKLGNGDGVVLAEKAMLENAKPYFVNGTCGGLFGNALHTEILDVEAYPETYSIIKEILNQ